MAPTHVADEAHPIVADQQDQKIVLNAQSNLNVLCLGVAHDVGQDLTQRLGRVLRAVLRDEFVEVLELLHVDLHTETSGHLAGERDDPILQRNVLIVFLIDLEDGGSDVVDCLVEFVERGIDALTHAIIEAVAQREL